MAKKEQKEVRKNISINTEEPLDEEKIDMAPLPEGDGEGEDDDLGLDENEVDPFGDKWEQ